jgi:lipopolysaccharide biosynthesis protein
MAGSCCHASWTAHNVLSSKRNPAEVVLSALRAKNLDTRLAEAPPWVLLKHPDLDWQWLVRAAKVNDLQKKLGFLTNVARRLAEKLGEKETATLLREQEAALERQIVSEIGSRFAEITSELLEVVWGVFLHQRAPS